MADNDAAQKPLTSLPFPPLTTRHILACSVPSWYPKFRSFAPKSRLISLSQPFIDYLRADGIFLPPEHKPPNNPDDSGYDDNISSTSWDDDEAEDPSDQWSEIHAQIQSTIRELGGKVYPKLNWSAPKDATWMKSGGNDMECRSANDIYLLLKSSDFVTHDLEHAFDDCVDDEGAPLERENWPDFKYHLVLRKSFNINPALEFRCFVRHRRLIGISQREMNYFAFLFELRNTFRDLIEDFVEDNILPGLDEEHFVVDVYIPPPHERVWLIDVNPWAVRTDPLLFSWLELLTMSGPEDVEDSTDEHGGSGEDEDGTTEDNIFRLRMALQSSLAPEQNQTGGTAKVPMIFTPEFRLVKRDDPEAYQFAGTKYSAHKLPKEVVDAGMAPGTMIETMKQWRRVLDQQQAEDDDDDDGEAARGT
jgi:hypothetical protein